MKRWLFLILALLLLNGCGAEPEATVPTAQPTEAPAQSATEPTGYYDPNSALEASTGGAVRVYPLNRSDSYGLVAMGDDLLLLSGSEVTTLTKLTGTTLYVDAAANLDCYIDAASPAFHAGTKGVTYYDEFHRELVYLDTALKEVSRFAVPETLTGSPALTADRKNLFYCTDSAIRAIDMETGLDKLVKELAFTSQALTALHCDGSILECRVTDSYGNDHALFISTETGETLWEASKELTLRTLGDRYFAIHTDGQYREFLTASGQQAPSLLLSDTDGIWAEAVLNMNGAVLYSFPEDSTALNFYNLETGTRTAALELPGGQHPRSILGDAAADCIWFVRYDEGYASDILCRWTLSGTAIEDGTCYLTARYTAASPDTAGLAACQETAAAISQKHGVDIFLWTAATAYQPGEYQLEAEYQVPVIARYLEILDEALSRYPSGFLKKAASGTSGQIRICLVRSITADAAIPENTSGIQYWDNAGYPYVALAMHSVMEQALFHELFHVIDSYVMSNCSVYDTWSDLNPKGFCYTYSDTATLEDAYAFLEGNSRAFIDEHSMSFPIEDRARIMEYAMMSGNESYFASEIMQRKLAQLCDGIRDAFGLKKSTETFIWEQYLTNK